jgi:hypothetical protein
MPLELRSKHLERLHKPSATLTLTCQNANLNKVRVIGLHLDVEVTAERGHIMEELSAESQWKDPGNVEDFPRTCAPMISIA